MISVSWFCFYGTMRSSRLCCWWSMTSRDRQEPETRCAPANLHLQREETDVPRDDPGKFRRAPRRTVRYRDRDADVQDSPRAEPARLAGGAIDLPSPGFCS